MIWPNVVDQLLFPKSHGVPQSPLLSILNHPFCEIIRNLFLGILSFVWAYGLTVTSRLVTLIDHYVRYTKKVNHSREVDLGEGIYNVLPQFILCY